MLYVAHVIPALRWGSCSFHLTLPGKNAHSPPRSLPQGEGANAKNEQTQEDVETVQRFKMNMSGQGGTRTMTFNWVEKMTGATEQNKTVP